MIRGWSVKDTKNPPGQARYLRDVIARIDADDRLETIQQLKAENERLRRQLIKDRERGGDTKAEAADKEVEFVRELQLLPGARDWSGEASCQAAFVLGDGSTLVIGVTDDDVAFRTGLWCRVT